jgi:hypothetical protein
VDLKCPLQLEFRLKFSEFRLKFSLDFSSGLQFRSSVQAEHYFSSA